MNVRKMQSHEIIDGMRDSACCLLCGTLEDPFVGCEHKAQMLYDSMEYKNRDEGVQVSMKVKNHSPFEINGFTVGCVDGKWKVWHPIYDGAFDVFTADTREEVVAWCEKEVFDEWTKKLM